MRSINILITYIIIFQTINDNLMVDLFGPDILKFTLVAFVIINFRQFLTFNYLIGINKYVLLFMIASVLSLFINWKNIPDVQLPIITLIAVTSYFIIFSQDQKVKHVISAILISLLSSSIYCILRDDTITEYTFRKTGGTGDPNEFSTMLLIGIGLVWGQYLQTRKRMFSSIFIILFFVMALVLAGSMSALIVLGILLLLGSYFTFRTSKVIKRFRSIGVLILVLLSIYFFVDSFFNESLSLFFERFENRNSGLERLKSWKAGMEVFRDNLFFGVGPTNYANILEIEFEDSIDASSRDAHNVYVKVFVETGILGFLPFLIFIWQKTIFLIRSHSNFATSLMMVGPFLMGFTLSLTFEKYFWLVLALSSNRFFKNYFNE